MFQYKITSEKSISEKNLNIFCKENNCEHHEIINRTVVDPEVRERQEDILKMIKNSPEQVYHTSSICQFFNINRRTANRDLTHLYNKGLIAYEVINFKKGRKGVVSSEQKHIDLCKELQ